jgi:hypothetical protein
MGADAGCHVNLGTLPTQARTARELTTPNCAAPGAGLLARSIGHRRNGALALVRCAARWRAPASAAVAKQRGRCMRAE